MEVTERSDGRTMFECQVCGREACLLQRDPGASKPSLLGDVDNNDNNTGGNKVWLNFKVQLLCGACKKFYTRCKAKLKDNIPQECTCPLILQKIRKSPDDQNNCNSQKNNNNGAFSKQMCWYCRYQRCQAVISQRNGNKSNKETANENEDSNGTSVPNKQASTGQQKEASTVRLIPCQVCGASSSGYHFGVISCEGCKGFFRRSLNKNGTYQCTRTMDPFGGAADDGDDDLLHQSKCKLCRWKQCLAAGMSTDAVRTGRHSIQRKVETSVHMQNLAAENRLLQETVFRRDHRRQLVKKSRQDALESYRNTAVTGPNAVYSYQQFGAGSDSASSSSNTNQNGYYEAFNNADATGESLHSNSHSGSNSPTYGYQSFTVSPSNRRLSNDSYSGGSSAGSRVIDVDQLDTAMADRQNYENARFESNTGGALVRWAQASAVERPITYDLMTSLPNNGGLTLVFNDLVLTSIAESTHGLNANILASRCDPLTFDMTLAEVWTKIVKTSFEPHLKAVSLFVRALPGFQRLHMADRMRLFSNSYFPILLAVLSHDFDAFSGRVNYFSLPDFTSRRVFKTLFGCDHNDTNERQFRDAGHSTVQWSPNTLEFGIMCGLLFYNPKVPGLENAQVVADINSVYRLADERFNQRYDAQRQRMQNFSVMVGYFEQMNKVFALGIENMRTFHPQLLALHPLFSEVHSLLTAPPLTVDELRQSNYSLGALES